MKVTVTLERAELAELEELYPEESRSGAIRRGILELPEVRLASEIAGLERAAERQPPEIPRMAESAEAVLSYREWRHVQQVLSARCRRLEESQLLKQEAVQFSQWLEALPIPPWDLPAGKSVSDEVAVRLSLDDWRQVRWCFNVWLDARDVDAEEVAFRYRYYKLERELEDQRLRRRHHLEWRRDTLRVEAITAKLPRP